MSLFQKKNEHSKASTSIMDQYILPLSKVKEKQDSAQKDGCMTPKPSNSKNDNMMIGTYSLHDNSSPTQKVNSRKKSYNEVSKTMPLNEPFIEENGPPQYQPRRQIKLTYDPTIFLHQKNMKYKLRGDNNSLTFEEIGQASYLRDISNDQHANEIKDNEEIDMDDDRILTSRGYGEQYGSATDLMSNQVKS